MKKILAIVLSLFASEALAQWQVPNHSVPIGRGSGSGFKNVPPANTRSFLGGAGASADPTMRELVPSDLPSPPITINATASGSTTTITLVPAYLPTGVTTIQNRMRFSFVAPFSSSVSGFVNISIPTLSVTTVNLYQPDGYTWTYIGDIQLGQPIVIEYSSAITGFFLVNPGATSTGFTAAFPNGSVTLQASTADTISLLAATGGPGGAILQWNSTAGAYRLVRVMPLAAYSQNLFNSTADVEGVTNQTLANSKLYGVYLNPQSGAGGSTAISPAAPTMSFWRFEATYYPSINAAGLLVLTDGNGVQYDQYHFLGLVYTRVADITNYIAPTDARMGNAVYSHYFLGRERFGYNTTPHANTTSSTSYVTQTLPAVETVTEGISDGPSYVGRTMVTCTTDARTATVKMVLSGTGYVSGIGGAFSGESQEASVYLPTANKPAMVYTFWESAPPISQFVAQIATKVDGGTCTFTSSILGSLPQ